MEQLFEKKNIRCLNRALWQVQEREYTQDLRLGEELPDIDTVVCARGQCVLRSKEWAADSVCANGGVTVWIMYIPQEGGNPQTVEVWIPITQKWELPQGTREGTVRIGMQLKGVDARSVSPRKLIARATVSMTAEALEPWETDVFLPSQMPEDIQLLRHSYPAMLPMEAGEKTFLIDEELPLSAGSPAIDRIMCYELHSVLTDRKVIGGKAVFRGTARLHLCYQSTDGAVCTADLEAPFSQYSDLERDYDKDATVSVIMAQTSVEPELADGAVRLKCGLSAQYTVWDQNMVELVEDAYSPDRCVKPELQELALPMLLDQNTETLRSGVNIPGTVQRVVDVWAYPAQCKLRRAGALTELEHSGTVGVMYEDEAGQLRGAAGVWSEVIERPCGESTEMMSQITEVSRPTVLMGADGLEVKLDCVIQTKTVARDGMAMICGMEMGEPVRKDPSRPSLILRRAGEESLWELAKSCRSTVDAIRSANALSGEPVDDRILLIPVS